MTETAIVTRPEDPGPAGDERPASDRAADEWGMQSFPASDPPQNW